MHALSSTNKHTARPHRGRLGPCPHARGIAAREHPLLLSGVLLIVISTSAKARRVDRPTGQWNSTTTTSRTSALTSTSVASQSRSSFAARHKTSYRLRSTLAQGFLSKPSKEPVGVRKHNSSTSPLLEARHRRTSRRPDLARGRQSKASNKPTQKLSACYGHARP